MLLGACLGMCIGVTGVIPYTSGIFLPHLVQEFGWARSGISLGQTLQAGGTALAVIFAGRFVDASVRRPAAIGLAGFGVCILSLASLQGRIEIFWLTFALIGLFGGACGPLVFSRAVNQNFDRHRGLALGLTIGGVGLGAAIYPLALTAVTEQFGWRAGYVALGSLVLVLAPLVVWLIGTGNKQSGSARVREPLVPMRWQPVLASTLFWRLFVAFFLAATAVTGYLLHLVPMLRDAGVSPTQSAGMQSAIGIAVLCSRLLTGPAADRIFAPYLAALCMAAAAIGAAAFASLGVAFALPAILLIGVALGCEVDLISYMVARYYPIAVYGRIYGVLYAAALVGAGAGPTWVGAVADATGGYAGALWVSCAALSIAALLFVTAPRFADLRTPSARPL